VKENWNGENIMNATRKCSRCGTELSGNHTEDQCPKCLLEFGLETQVGAGSNPTNPTDPPKRPPPSIADLTPRFPQFEIMEFLGQGGMGLVYKARQLSLDRIVALKILAVDKSEGRTFAERFTQEARALARLNHPNIVAVYDFGQSDGQYFLLMEYVDGLNLRQLERSGGVTPQEAIKIIPSICDALQYAHNRGIVHRDIKPENILLDQAGQVKIADFGLAKLLQRAGPEPALTQAEQVMGTPHYMAPEQLEHPLEVDHRADLYSLGVVFYEMLTGELPLGKFAPPSNKVEIDVRLDQVVLRALERERERRYQQASEIKTDLASVSASPPKAEKMTSESERATLPSRHQVERVGDSSRRWFFTTATIVLIGLLLIGFLVIGSMFLAVALPTFMRARQHALDTASNAQAQTLYPDASIIKAFTTEEQPLTGAWTVSGEGWFLDSEQAQVVRLFEVGEVDVGPGVLFYEADLKTEGFDGRVYLEMWCRFPGRGEFFSRGLRQSLTGTTGWVSTHTPFILKKGEEPEMIRLNLAVEGAGRVWVRNVRLSHTTSSRE
jgi:serine/threonine protein kinase